MRFLQYKNQLNVFKGDKDATVTIKTVTYQDQLSMGPYIVCTLYVYMASSGFR